MTTKSLLATSVSNQCKHKGLWNWTEHLLQEPSCIYIHMRMHALMHQKVILSMLWNSVPDIFGKLLHLSRDSTRLPLEKPVSENFNISVKLRLLVPSPFLPSIMSGEKLEDMEYWRLWEVIQANGDESPSCIPFIASSTLMTIPERFSLLFDWIVSIWFSSDWLVSIWFSSDWLVSIWFSSDWLVPLKSWLLLPSIALIFLISLDCSLSPDMLLFLSIGAPLSIEACDFSKSYSISFDDVVLCASSNINPGRHIVLSSYTSESILLLSSSTNVPDDLSSDIFRIIFILVFWLSSELLSLTPLKTDCRLRWRVLWMSSLITCKFPNISA